MPPNKVFASADDAVADIPEGATLLVGGYARPGTPQGLIGALLRRGVGSLTCIGALRCGEDRGVDDVASLVAGGLVARVITSAPVDWDPQHPVARMWQEGRLDVEVVPRGVLAERVRAGGAGLGGLFMPAYGASQRDGVETKRIGDKEYVLEPSITAGFALLRGHRADTLGNLVYRRAQRDWNPVMAMAAEVTIVEVDEIVDPGGLDPELVVTPGIYVDRIGTSGGR